METNTLFHIVTIFTILLSANANSEGNNQHIFVLTDKYNLCMISDENKQVMLCMHSEQV